MRLIEWAKRWNICDQALIDLQYVFGITPLTISNENLSEAGVQSIVKLEASQKGCRLWRNNVGATYTPDGSFIRYGLANDSAALNKQIKSADLIGIRPVRITHEMVGGTIGQFLSREIKSSNWKFTGNEREQAQLRWCELIFSLGGDACFAIGKGTL